MRFTQFVTPVFRVFIVALITLTSCVNTRKSTYFNDLKDSRIEGTTIIPETVIQSNDIISITVSSLNIEGSEIYNEPNVIVGPNGKQLYGYLVNSSGYIQFPVIGSVKAAGLTKDQLKSDLTDRLIQRKLLLDPIVSIRFQNFRVTVLGEVKNPAVLPVPNEKISLLEAIGLAGDLTIYAKRNNVLLIREEAGVKIVKRIDLNSTELFTSPYYYLQSNDIVYVEPNKAKVASAGRAQQLLPILFSALTFATIVADRLIK